MSETIEQRALKLAVLARLATGHKELGRWLLEYNPDCEMRVEQGERRARIAFRGVDRPPPYIGYQCYESAAMEIVLIVDGNFAEWLASVRADGLPDTYHQPMMLPADLKIGHWLSAALEDPQTCVEFRQDIEAWMALRQFPPPTGCQTSQNVLKAQAIVAAAQQLDQDHSQARAVHRVIRAMHDGECPRCGGLFASTVVKYSTRAPGWVCPRCRFAITEEEGEAAIKAFHPFMLRNLEVFEQWRAARKNPIQVPPG